MPNTAVEAKSEVHVAVGILHNPRGEVLISRRPDHAHQGGLWEFPGGKVEADEPFAAALARELREELGVEVLDARPLIRVRHRYADKAVLLDVWRVERYRGQPRGCEGQPLAWRHPRRLAAAAFPAADRPIITALRLPAEYLITGGPADQDDVFLHRLERALIRGVRLAQLRAKELPSDRLERLFRQARRLAHDYGATLLLNASPQQALAWEADGVHLTAARLLAARRRPLPEGRWVAASCHDLHEVRHACRIGVDFIVAAPVGATASHPGARTLGWEGLQRLADAAMVPVYALGGVGPADLPRAWACGAQGIAAIRALWEG
ncbi:MAG: Nudix family hydrolase [Pseudomonadota bacterium]|nr:Nudix family hydrolase [Pseudomonadota bacterium]